MPRVVHFEIHAADPEKTIAFYQSVFGWQFQAWAGPLQYWLISTGPDGEPGIHGGLVARQGPSPTDGQPVSAYVCTVGVPAFDEFAGKIAGAGGTTVVPKMPIPGVGWLGYFKDPAGNIFGIMQSDPQAQ